MLPFIGQRTAKMVRLVMFTTRTQHIQNCFYALEQLLALLGSPVFHTGVWAHAALQEPLLGEEGQILLELAVAHVGAIHDLRLASLLQPQDVGYDLHARPSIVYLQRRLSIYLLWAQG